MSKINKVIAGLGVVAGLGVALAPVATFADTAMGADDLTVTVESDCAIDTSSEAFAGVYSGNGTPDTEASIAKTGGSNSVAFGCSANSMITVSAATEGLALGSIDTIAPTALSVSLTGENGMTIANTWKDTYGALAASTVVANGKAVAGQNMSFTVNGYKAQLKADQEPGTYTGTVTYTFALANN